jgi:hypothetical protein
MLWNSWWNMWLNSVWDYSPAADCVMVAFCLLYGCFMVVSSLMLCWCSYEFLCAAEYDVEDVVGYVVDLFVGYLASCWLLSG